MEFIELTADNFTTPARKPATGPRGPRKRSEVQTSVDKMFARAMAGNGILALQVKPEDVGQTTKLVKSSARLNERALTEGEPRPGTSKGLVIVSWRIRVPVKRKPKTETRPASQAPSK